MALRVNHTGPSVLVLDDVPAIVDELLTLLELHDIESVGAATLEGAIVLLSANPTIRAISCDLRLGPDWGLDIVERVKNHPELCNRDLQYLFVTGDNLQAVELPGAGYAVLSKPVRPDKLVDTLSTMLQCRSTEDHRG